MAVSKVLYEKVFIFIFYLVLLAHFLPGIKLHESISQFLICLKFKFWGYLNFK